MLLSFLKRFSGSHYRRYLSNLKPLVTKINRIEAGYQSLSDEALRAKTQEFMERYGKGEMLDQLLPEAFAVVKQTARRLQGKSIPVCGQQWMWNMVPYDVQLIGGIALHQNKIAEMATGEGKTLVSTLPLYLNALSGRNCHLVTVNDYLARRDAEWMGAIYKFLGLTVGVIQNQMRSAERRAAYKCNLTYGTASEFGFDYLRDNGMAFSKTTQVQRGHYYAIVDEVDSILIDEARTPLIISGPMQQDDGGERFKHFKLGIERLAKRQLELCDRLATEAQRELETPNREVETSTQKLLQVRLGSPKHPKLLRLLENGTYRRLLEKFEVEMNSDFNKNRLYELKEALFYTIDEKQHQADLTERGRNAMRPEDPNAFVLPDLTSLFVEIDSRKELSAEQRQQMRQAAEERFSQTSEAIHCISQLLRAYSLYERDVAYVVQEGRVIIVDENTGRLMPGRRWSDGLHQAIEAKEGVVIERESKTYATVTLQNYFRMYEKLAGMTGTAETEATEFYDIYRLPVVVIPTHRPCIRRDENDVIYKTRREKYRAVVAEIERTHRREQPILVGTISVEASEQLSRMLRNTNIPHNVLNAKFHQQEAQIIARAGQAGAVTIATNMAGRGTDIKLGEGVTEGLRVIGTERHESRRIDRQLRGRCARQGDPGSSKFFVSLEDDLMRLFANAGPLANILQKTFQEGEVLEHPLLNRSIQSAQKKVEQQNFSIRKLLLQYDDVLNKQREIIYGIRNEALHSERPKTLIFEMIEEELTVRIETAFSEKGGRGVGSSGSLESFLTWINMHFPVALRVEDIKEDATEEVILAFILERIQQAYTQKEAIEDPAVLIELEGYVITRAVDKHWQDHLTEIEDLRRSVGLRGYGQKDPLNEYKNDAYVLFEEMMGRIRTEICIGLFRSVSGLDAFKAMLQQAPVSVQHENPVEMAALPTSSENKALPPKKPAAPVRRVTKEKKTGRNQPCPCGSGKKYKNCCGNV